MPQFNKDDDAQFVANLEGSRFRKQYLREIIICTLRQNGPLTKPQLQKTAQIRKAKFLTVLKTMVEMKTVLVRGNGVKGDPRVYELAEGYGPQDTERKRKGPIFTI